MPVARQKVWFFIFHLAFVRIFQSRRFGFFILFVYTMQQRLMGILSVATEVQGSTQRFVLLSSYSGTTPSLTLNFYGHCDSPVESPVTTFALSPSFFPLFRVLSLPVSADERGGVGDGEDKYSKTTAKESWSFSFYIPFMVAALPFCAESSADWTIFSDSESRAEVASSRSRIGGFRTSALQHTTNRFTSYLALCHFCGAPRLPQSVFPFLSILPCNPPTLLYLAMAIFLTNIPFLPGY
jgi:hypothetical protein